MYGLADFNASKALFNLVKLDIVMKTRKLNPFEMLILCLMRLRLGMAVVNLPNRFQRCKPTVSKIFLLGLDVQDCVKLWPITIWPEGSELIAILYIERPTSLAARSLTWSYYASNNTVKYLIGIIPHDTIRSILKVWDRHTSYQHVTEHSGFLKYLIYADTVMADCWFNIASKGCWYVHSWSPPALSSTLLKGGGTF